MPITLRRGVPSDAPVVTEFNYRLALESEGKELDRVVLSAGVSACLADASKAMYFLAEEEGMVIGQLAITLEWSDWRNGWLWWVQSVYVRQENRRQGVFRSLYEHVRQQALAQGNVVGIRLYVEEENHAAQKTYFQLGMERTGYLVLEQCPLQTETTIGGH